MKLIPVPRWADHHDWPTIQALRWMIFNAETNGFKDAFIRVGRRVLVDEEKFFDCVRRRDQESKRIA